MSKTRLALIVAMIFALPAGVVALEQSASSWDAESSELAQDILAAAAEPAEADAAQPESLAQAEPEMQPEVVVHPTARSQPVPASSTFPRNDDVGDQMLPGLLAYLERVEQQRAHLIARGDAFPTADPMGQPLPALVAYLDRIEQARIAAAEPQQAAQVAGVEAAPVTAAGGTEELVIAHTSASR